MSTPPGTAFIAKLVFLTELRSLVRDRRAMFSAFVLPFLLYPLFLLAQTKLETATREGLEGKEVGFALVNSDGEIQLGTERAPLSEILSQLEQLLPLEGPCTIEVLAADDSWDFERWQASEAEPERVLIQITNDESDSGKALIEFYYDGSNDLANEARRRAREAFRTLRRETEARRLAALVNVDPGAVLEFEVVDLASDEDQSGAALGRLLPLLLVLSILAGGSMASLAAFAGERENGTLETLLVQPAPSTSLAWGKFLAVALTALGTLLANGASLLLCAGLGIESKFLPEGTLSPDRLILALVLFMPALLLLCAALTYVSSRARTFREGQQTLLPLTLVAALPSAIALLPSMDFTPLAAVIPIAGPSLALRDALTGNLNLGVALWMFVVNSFFAALLLRGIGGVLEAERLLRSVGSSLEAAQRRLRARNGLRWGFLAVFLVYVLGGAIQARDPLVGLMVTLWVLLPVLTWLCARSLASEKGWAASLGLCWPEWSRMLGALLCAPGLALLMTQVLELQQKVIPLPRSASQAAEALSFLDEMPLPWILFILAVSPGICEELFFRGAVLQSLRRDLSPTKIVLWQGLLFGLVHSSVFRFAPTAILGALLAIVTLRARCLWPAMLLHATYNASAHGMHQLGEAGLPESLQPLLEGWGPELAAGASALGLFLLFRGTRKAAS